jgi:hypothetical protein
MGYDLGYVARKEGRKGKIEIVSRYFSYRFSILK